MGNLIVFMREIAQGLQDGGSYGTAHVYRSSVNALQAFYGKGNLPFQKVTPELLKQFETHLRGRGCSWNTVSTYMRTLRAVHNRAIERRKAAYVPQLFKHVYTGTKADRKRAMEHKEIALLLNESTSETAYNKELKRTKELFVLMFLLRGLPFVDLVYLKKSDLEGNTITYRRRKTGRILSVTLPTEAMDILKKYENQDSDSPYLFPFLINKEGTKEAYREYQIALRHFNNQLALLKETMGLKSEISSYTARHTWATMAYYCEVHPGIISEAMGHSSIMVTETYLKPFRNKKIDEANLKVINYSKQQNESLSA